MKYLLLFILIQAINVPLAFIGLVVCLSPTLARDSWLWWNSIDPPQANWSWWQSYYWLALRNPVSNLRLIPVVSGPNRPLWYKTWTMRVPVATVWTMPIFGHQVPVLVTFALAPKQFYAKAGWTSNTYPVCSAGSGRGY